MHRLCRLKVVGVLLTGTRRLLYIPAASFKLQLFTENSLLARLYKTLGIVMAVVYKLIYAPTHTLMCVGFVCVLSLGRRYISYPLIYLSE
jgi:hypothetical protein